MIANAIARIPSTTHGFAPRIRSLSPRVRLSGVAVTASTYRPSPRARIGLGNDRDVHPRMYPPDARIGLPVHDDETAARRRPAAIPAWWPERLHTGRHAARAAARGGGASDE